MSYEKRLRELGIVLPRLPQPKGSYLPGVIHNGILHLSGQGPWLEDGTLAKGTVGVDVTVPEARFHAYRTGLVLLSAARELLGTLDLVERVISIMGMLNAEPGLEEHPQIIDGCSDLFISVFGENGRHARAAVGMGSLPENITVEITAMFAIKP